MHHRVIHNLLSMRSRPEPGAELVSQALFGDSLIVLETSGDYALVKTLDDYEGWSLSRHIVPDVIDEPFEELIVSDAFAPLFADPARPFSLLTTLSIGSRVRIAQAGAIFTGISLAGIGFGVEVGYVATSALAHTAHTNSPNVSIPLPYPSRTLIATGTPSALNPLRGARGNPGRGTDAPSAKYLTPNTKYPIPNPVLTYAHRLIGTPYMWGGTSAFGIDCSGFVQRVFGMCGVPIPRDAYLQAENLQKIGMRTSETEPPEPLDLVFFLGREDPRQRGITHVGIALSGDSFIHSSGSRGVGISRFNEAAVTSEYTYRGGLRII